MCGPKEATQPRDRDGSSGTKAKDDASQSRNGDESKVTSEPDEKECYFKTIDLQIENTKIPIYNKDGVKSTKEPSTKGSETQKGDKKIYLLSGSKSKKDIEIKIDGKSCEIGKHSGSNPEETYLFYPMENLSDSRSVAFLSDDELTENLKKNAKNASDSFIGNVFLVMSPLLYLVNKTFGTTPLIDMNDIAIYLKAFKFWDYILLPDNLPKGKIKLHQMRFDSCKETVTTDVYVYPDVEFGAALNVDIGSMINIKERFKNKSEIKSDPKVKPDGTLYTSDAKYRKAKTDEDRNKALAEMQRDAEKQLKKQEWEKAQKRIKETIQSDKDKAKEKAEESDTQKKEERPTLLKSSGIRMAVYYEGEDHTIFDATKVYEVIKLILNASGEILEILKAVKVIEPEITGLVFNLGTKWKYDVKDDYSKLGSLWKLELGFNPLFSGKLTIRLIELALSALPGGAFIVQLKGIADKVIEKLGLKDFFDLYFNLVLEGKLTLMTSNEWGTYKKLEGTGETTATLKVALSAGFVGQLPVMIWFIAVPFTKARVDLKASAEVSITMGAGVSSKGEGIHSCGYFNGLVIKGSAKGSIEFFSRTLIKGDADGELKVIDESCLYNYSNNEWNSGKMEKNKCYINCLGLMADCPCTSKPKNVKKEEAERKKRAEDEREMKRIADYGATYLEGKH